MKYTGVLKVKTDKKNYLWDEETCGSQFKIHLDRGFYMELKKS